MGWVTTSALAKLEPEAKARLSAIKAGDLPKGTTLFHPGDEVQGFAIVLTGMVGVYLTGAGGREILLYDITHAGLATRIKTAREVVSRRLDA